MNKKKQNQIKDYDKVRLHILKNFYNLNGSLKSQLKRNLTNKDLLNKLNALYASEKNRVKKETISIILKKIGKIKSNISYEKTMLNFDSSFSQKAKKTIEDFDKQIKVVHRENIELLKLKNKKSFTMITFNPIYSTFIDLSTQIDFIIGVRQIIRQVMKDDFKKRGKTFKYQAIPEISLNYNGVHLHIHFYIYELITNKTQILKKIRRNINNLMRKLSIRRKKLSLHIKEFSIDKWTEVINYSSMKNNLRYKIKGKDLIGIKYILFAIMKLFGRQQFISNSRISIPFSQLKPTMISWIVYLKGNPLDYYTLMQKMQDPQWMAEFESMKKYFAITFASMLDYYEYNEMNILDNSNRKSLKEHFYNKNNRSN